MMQLTLFAPPLTCEFGSPWGRYGCGTHCKWCRRYALRAVWRVWETRG